MDGGNAQVTFEEMRQAAQAYHTQGDAMGMYRFLRQRVEEAADGHEEGIARTLLADALILWHLGSRNTVAAELSRAKALLKPYPEDRALALFVHMYWCGTENDLSEFSRVLATYERLCQRHTDLPGVQRWRGRISQWFGRLALAQGDLGGATVHFERSLVEFEKYEPDPGSREQLIRMSKLRLAEFALRRGDLPTARRYLDECEGSTISRLWETIRACTEVQYAIRNGSRERAQFWLRLAHSWATPQSEAATMLTLAQARLSYALGELNKARLLTLEARRLAASHKQDHLLPEIREFFRVQSSGLGAGQLTQGGIPYDEAFGRMAVSGPAPGPLPDRHGRR